MKHSQEIEVAHSNKRIFISQKKYIVEFLKDIGKLACKLENTPIDPNHKVGKTEKDVAVNKD